MREIKFKARFICPNCNKTYWLEFRCGQVMLLNQQDSGKAYVCDKVGGFCDQHQTGEIVQFTGLKDKNGVEVYESDICRVHVFTQELGENMGVCEGEKEFIASLHMDWQGLVLVNKNGDNSGPLNCYYGFEEPSEQLEKIGDIFSNPELLEVE